MPRSASTRDWLNAKLKSSARYWLSEATTATLLVNWLFRSSFSCAARNW